MRGASCDRHRNGSGRSELLAVHLERIGTDGNLYVAGGNSDDIRRFNGTTGAFIDSITEHLDNPGDITFGPDSNLYVANYYFGAVSRYNGVTGAFIDDFIPAGSGGLGNPHGLLFGPDGTLYVSSNAGTVKKYHGTTGAYLGDFTSDTGFLPQKMAFGPDGNFYVVEDHTNKVKRYNGLTGVFIDDFVPEGSGGLSNPSFLLFVTPGSPYIATVQRPIKRDGSSVFKAKRGVVPVKFTLALDGALTCNLPPATISLTRTSDAIPTLIDESIYVTPADNGSNFRISDCHYIYNLGTKSLGQGTYVVEINIEGVAVGSATFRLK